MVQANGDMRRIYREALAEAGPDGTDRQELLIVASARIATEIRAGRMAFDMESAIRAELVKIDESEGKKADAIIRTAATGQGSFDEVDLDVVVTLGKGRRKQWRDITAADLTLMDEVRFQNFRDVRDSFDEWHSYFTAIRPVVFQYSTFGAAFAAGGFPPPSEQSAAG